MLLIETDIPPPGELHPWNKGFTWSGHHEPLRCLTPEHAEQFDRDGYVVLPDVFTDDELAPVVEACDALEATTDEFLASREDGRFPWHQDNGYTFVEPQQYLTCWLALTDATVDNGCPQVLPGLHRSGTLAHHYADPLGWEIFEDHADAVAAPVGKGGIVVFSSLTPHLTGPNTTDAVRKAYILQYAPDGAETLHGDPTSDAQPTRAFADDPARQFPVLVADRHAAPGRT